jgi:haloalkane dehalogenase
MHTDFVPDSSHFSFTSRWLEGPYGRHHYVDEGAGRVVLLCHGNPTWSFLYRKMIRGLVARGYRCVAADMLGYGLSDHPSPGLTASAQADALLSLVRALDLRDFIVVGQDWGGPVGLGAAVQVPERVHGIVLGSTFAWRASGMTRFIAHLLRSGLAQRWMLDSEGFIPRVFSLAGTKLTEDELAHYRLVAASAELRRARTVLPRELIDADPWLDQLERALAERLPNVRALVLHPSRDGMLGKAAAKRFAAMFRDSAIVELPGAGHFFQEDAPDEAVAAIVSRFGSD